jgi:fructose 1,6-bisphosphatase
MWVALGAMYCVKDGKLTASVDLFDHPFWDEISSEAADNAIEIRRQGFPGVSVFPDSELECGGIVEILERLESRFIVRAGARAAEGLTN